MNKEQSAYIRKLYMEIRDAEKEMRGRPMPELTKEDFFLFRETGNRLVYENAYFGRRKYLTVYAILALWGGEQAAGDYIGRLGEILLEICREKFWALPAHVDFDRIDQPETALTIDLFAAETAQALSEITLRLYDRLPEDIIARVAYEVTRRVLLPFVSSEVPYSWWETDRCNWSAVCAGSVGMAAINIDALNSGIMTDHSVRQTLMHMIYLQCHKELPSGWKESCLKRVCDALGCYLDGMEADGACTEGLGYYNYGMSFYAAFAEQYSAEGDITGDGRERLMYRDKCEQIALFQQKCYFRSRFGDGLSISFSDGSRHESFLPGLTAYLKHCYPGVQTPDYALARPFGEDACYRYLTNERNINWLFKYADRDAGHTVENKTEKNSDGLTTYLLPSAQWLVCQDENGNGFAAKGGNNDENHNHNDIGHFLCVFNGEMLLTDLGAGEYTRDYFSDRRYEILCNRSSGHSVPLVNGEEQRAGKDYHADCFEWDDRGRTLTMEFAGAYPKGILGKLVRRIGINTGEEPRMQVLLRDTFVTNENTDSVTENMVTEYEPAIQDGGVWIRGTHGKCKIMPGEGQDAAFTVIPCTHQGHDGKSRTVYRITWEVRIKKCKNADCEVWINFYDS